MPQKHFSSIDKYGLVGNLHTSALIDDTGSIDMFCAPYFDSPSLFCKSLDHNGGYCRVQPDFSDDNYTLKQRYLPGTNTLSTRWLNNDCAIELLDAFIIPEHVVQNTKIPDYEDWMMLRQVQVTRGSVPICIECIPAFNYARNTHTVDIQQNMASFTTEPIDITLKDVPKEIKFEYMSTPKECHLFYIFTLIYSAKSERCIKWDYMPVENSCGVTAEIIVNEDEILWVGLCSKYNVISHEDCLAMYKRTNQYWRKWISNITYSGKWQEHMERSALVLKLLSFYPTGAIVAAPTFSFPEHLTGERNWDYRYIWVRDSSFTMYSLIRLGLVQEAHQCLKFVEHICKNRKPDNGLYIMYTIHGCPYIPETTFDHLSGHCNSYPVRIGNGAWDHIQLDIYGELLDAVYLFNKFGMPIGFETWLNCIELVNYVVEHYNDIDASIWEVRGESQHFLYSKVMCWVALDRGLRLAEKRDLPCPDSQKWKACKDKLYLEIMDKGFNGEYFKQSYSSDALDASAMIMSLVFFCPATDPRMLQTTKQILMPVEKGGLMRNRLILRYDVEKTKDGLKGEEGAFLMVTFWTIEVVTRIAEYQPELRDKVVGWFEEVIQYATPLGLFSEEVSKDGQLLGNFPQAFSHLAFISCAYRLDQLLKTKKSFKLLEFDLF